MCDDKPLETLPIPAARSRAGASLQLVVSAAAAAFVVLFSICVIGRFGYPFDLEVMEGGMADHVDRLRAGGRLYVSPGLEFTPFLYAPLYYYVSAAVTSLTGDALIALRSVSVVSTMATFALLAAMVRRLGGSWHVAILAVGLYAASYERVLAFHDIARVDPLFVLLVFATLLLIHRRPMGIGRAIVAAALAAAAVHTKQLAVIALAPAGLWALVFGGRGERIFCLATVVFTLGAMGVLEWLHDDWYSYYLIEVPSGHRLVDAVWSGFWTGDILPVYGPALVLASLGLFFWSKARKSTLRETGYAVAILVGVVAAGYLGRLHEGGEPNTIMPLCAGIAVLSALAVGAVRALAERGGAWRRGALVVVELAMLVQLGLLAYDPGDLVPSRVDRIVAARCVQDLEEVEQPILVLTESRVFAAMGRPAHAHSVAIFDVMKGVENPNESSSSRLPAVSAGLKQEFIDAIQAREFAGVVYPFYSFFDNDAYRLTNIVYSPTFLGGTGIPTMTGRLQRPLFIFVPRR